MARANESATENRHNDFCRVHYVCIKYVLITLFIYIYCLEFSVCVCFSQFFFDVCKSVFCIMFPRSIFDGCDIFEGMKKGCLTQTRSQYTQNTECIPAYNKMKKKTSNASETNKSNGNRRKANKSPQKVSDVERG